MISQKLLNSFIFSIEDINNIKDQNLYKILEILAY